MDTVGETVLLASAKKGKKKNWSVCCQQMSAQQLFDQGYPFYVTWEFHP